jgi:dipeptide/tripeptide permease
VLRVGVGLSTERDSARAAAEAAAVALRSGGLERADCLLVFATTPHGPGFTRVTRTAGEVCGTRQIVGCSAAGVLAGGFLADYTEHHGYVAAACFAANAAIVLLIALVTLPGWALTATMATAGFLSGVIAPSRDMLVRNAAPPGAAGRAFGIVSTGFNLGGIASPLLFGWIMDQSAPHWVFGASVIFMLATVVLSPFTERRAQGKA